MKTRFRRPGMARNEDAEHVHETAARLNTARLEAMVYNVVASHGPPRGLPLCVVQIWKYYLPELSIDTISPRMHRLVEKGWLDNLGKEPRENRYGNIRKQFVYQASERGREVIAAVRAERERHAGENRQAEGQATPGPDGGLPLLAGPDGAGRGDS